MGVRLKDLQIVEVSLVDRPANRRPLLLLRSEEPMPKEIKLSLDEALVPVIEKLGQPADGEDAAVGGLAKDAQPIGRVLARLMPLFVAAGGAVGKLFKADIDAQAETIAKAKVAEAEAARKAAEEKAEKARASRKIVKTATGEVDVTDMPEAHQKAFEELAKSHAATEAKLAAESLERRKRDLVVKAEKEFPHLKKAEVVELLLKVDGPLSATLEVVLKEAEAQAALGGAFKEKGSAAESGAAGDAMARIEAAGEAISKASGGKLTKEQGVSQFLKTEAGKALHEQYMEARQ